MHKTLYTLQFLRFLASLFVLLFHLNLMKSGYKGVDVFFVISGFVIYYSLFSQERPNALKFTVNRLTKIYFLYWLALVFLYGVEPYSIKGTFLGTLALVPGHHSVLGVSWSLSYELYFYFLAGTVFFLTNKKLHIPIFFVLFFSTTIVTFCNLTSYTFKGSWINFFFGPNFWQFLLGVGAAFSSTSVKISINSGRIAFAVAVCLLALCYISIPYNSPVSYIVYGVLSCFVVLLFALLEKRKRFNRVFCYVAKILGDASYAIYLFGPVVTILLGASDEFSQAITIAVTIGLSVFINQIIEVNFLSWSRKIIFNRL